jgi:hypothetical protein
MARRSLSKSSAALAPPEMTCGFASGNGASLALIRSRGDGCGGQPDVATSNVDLVHWTLSSASDEKRTRAPSACSLPSPRPRGALVVIAPVEIPGRNGAVGARQTLGVPLPLGRAFRGTDLRQCRGSCSGHGGRVNVAPLLARPQGPSFRKTAYRVIRPKPTNLVNRLPSDVFLSDAVDKRPVLVTFLGSEPSRTARMCWNRHCVSARYAARYSDSLAAPARRVSSCRN